MEEASRGATEAGGLAVGILPGPTRQGANPHLSVAIVTNLGHARNVVIAHSSDALVAIGKGFGTLSEMAIARKLGKPVVGFESFTLEGATPASSIEEVVEVLRGWLG
jgi:uncharacterized protein (TIGR00725 family)